MKALAILQTLAATALIHLTATAQCARLDEVSVDRLNGLSERHLAIDASANASDWSFLFLVVGRTTIAAGDDPLGLTVLPEAILALGRVDESIRMIRLPDVIDFELYAQAVVFDADRLSFCTSNRRNLRNVIHPPKQ